MGNVYYHFLFSPPTALLWSCLQAFLSQVAGISFLIYSVLMRSPVIGVTSALLAIYLKLYFMKDSRHFPPNYAETVQVKIEVS